MGKSTWYHPLLKGLLITWCCIKFPISRTGFELPTLVVIGTDCIGSCTIHTITAITAPRLMRSLYIEVMLFASKIMSVSIHPLIVYMEWCLFTYFYCWCTSEFLKFVGSKGADFRQVRQKPHTWRSYCPPNIFCCFVCNDCQTCPVVIDFLFNRLLMAM
jgi:hypothetical protein